MKHIVGNHKDCGEEWCTRRRAKIAGIPHNKPPIIDLSVETDRKTFAEVKKVFDRFTTDKRLQEIMHHFTTQANESLNMRLAELAPKFKNYSRTKTLDYLQQMVIAHHNVEMHQYYSNVFEHLKIPFTNHLASYLKRRHEWKIRKKELDGDPKKRLYGNGDIRRRI